ncbi:hypothetical protein [Pedobacter frigoris]|uniref:Uncharacterized protein n=1 Tax=Pedobacter frigoris TaxID=2571272 RepID=A0A4U1CFD0_9SPHI|nr:hypothetical protein [Pedobacter frigoris]TKC05250.1 hypothetical protein FA047_15960 [Pedobacter frigoris]
MNKKIWLALVEVIPLEGNEFITSDGAYVNVACLAESKSQFKSELHSNFERNKFKVLDIDDIETEKSLIVTNAENAERLRLIDEINEGYEFAWGTFYTFDR